ncbi:Putative cytochrome P450 [Septoria linicola]|uniref:Cytochrome P450 n=1 Tax=Septoria linicola TaxID=215465 RepID=A0A9Q9ALY9_9PEZI|nr:putative cytochrome P450 [Septoria linicola]USW51425.1 Putative cytochrome P450 [Septoria linicola]
MAVLSLDTATGHPYSLALGSFVVLASLVLYLFHKPTFPRNAPKLVDDTIPLIGALHFFTQRWDFWERARNRSTTGNFSFYAGQHPVVGVTGQKQEERKVFFEDKRLAFSEGYATLLAGAPEVKRDNKLLAENNNDSAFTIYFQKRLIALLKGNQLRNGLPQLLKDARMLLNGLAAQPEKITDPFDSIYRMVFQFTMRTVACSEIADDQPLLAKVLGLFESIESCATHTGIMYPWVPLPSKMKRTIAGAQLYGIFKKIVDDRNKTGRKEDDALQYLMDQGDNIVDIITFVLGALFAGQLNSGINASWILCYLANNAEWMSRVRKEVEEVADKYCANKDIPLKERLMEVPIEAWEGEFPMIDYCLKDTIRLQMFGTAFRKNLSNAEVVINKQTGEVIPPGYFAALGVGDIHWNPEIYTNPDEWDPARYLPDRAEDKKEVYAWMGWGLARHPCLGVRFAKLENNMIVAFFLAYFDNIQLADKFGNLKAETSPVDRNGHTAHKPHEPMYLKYQLRQD